MKANFYEVLNDVISRIKGQNYEDERGLEESTRGLGYGQSQGFDKGLRDRVFDYISIRERGSEVGEQQRYVDAVEWRESDLRGV